MKVLIIDDDEINNFITIKLIKKAMPNIEIMACLNGQFAIDRLKYDKQNGTMPDYILIDNNMPVMNGWEFIEEYSRLGFDTLKTKLLMIASSVFSNDVNRAREIPQLKRFISKPLNMEKVKEIFTHEA